MKGNKWCKWSLKFTFEVSHANRTSAFQYTSDASTIEIYELTIFCFLSQYKFPLEYLFSFLSSLLSVMVRVSKSLSQKYADGWCDASASSVHHGFSFTYTHTKCQNLELIAQHHRSRITKRTKFQLRHASTLTRNWPRESTKFRPEFDVDWRLICWVFLPRCSRRLHRLHESVWQVR